MQDGERYEFSQRLRYYLRVQLPLNHSPGFKKGLYAAVQNEYFANIQHRAQVNGRFFDQNRSFVSLGYRFSEALDLEGGYLYRYQIEAQKLHHHIVQVMVTTKL